MFSLGNFELVIRSHLYVCGREKKQFWKMSCTLHEKDISVSVEVAAVC